MGQWPTFVGFCTDEAAFKRGMKRLLNRDDIRFMIANGATTHFLTAKSGNVAIICIEPFNPRRRSREQYAALVAHEALHVVQQMNEDLSPGSRFDKENESYLLQHIVQTCLQWAWKSGKVRRTCPRS